MPVPRARKRSVGPLRFCFLFYGSIFVALVLWHFPYSSDAPTRRSASSTATAFYAQAYAAPTPTATDSEAPEDQKYVRIARKMAELLDIKGVMTELVRKHGLEQSRVLDVGAGRGYLQDLVDNYVGLDISPTARRYFHKPFVQASATDMPFHDGEFDAAWTVWVLEHVPNPEQMLAEMRRVVRPGGLILLAPAWLCTTWAAQGYEVRPYSDFSLGGKLVKASIPLRRNPGFQSLYLMPIRATRLLTAQLAGPTTFRYRRIDPNYKEYWVPDSDAVNSMDPYEALLWFTSRGDECLNCRSGMDDLTRPPDVLVIRVKPSQGRV